VNDVPFLKLAAVHAGDGCLNVFALNRDIANPLRLEMEARSFPALALRGAATLHHANLKAGNTAGAPDAVRPTALSGVAVAGARVTVELPPASWNLLRFGPD